MQINSVSGTLPSAVSNSSSAAPKPAKPAAAPAPQAASTVPPPVAQITPATPPPAAQATPAAPAARDPSSANPTGGAAPVQPAAPQAVSEAAASLVSQIYSTTVGGKSYSGSVEQSGGQYVISIPNVPGASASASTAQAAENALTLKIDILV
jgi:translation initiation factor IF-2